MSGIMVIFKIVGIYITVLLFAVKYYNYCSDSIRSIIIIHSYSIDLSSISAVF